MSRYGSTTDSWLMRHQLAAYLFFAFLIAWLFWVPLAVLYQGEPDVGALVRSPLVIVLQTLGVTGALIAVIVITGLTRGKAGVRRAFSGLKRWRVGLWWYAVACLLIPFLTLIGLGVRAVFGIRPAVPEGSALAARLSEAGWLGLVLTFPILLLLACFSSPLLEEPGWRGFALPHMQKRMSAALAALVVAAIWGLWHLPLYIAFDANLPIALTLITLHGFFLGWLYINTRSLLIAVLGHASLSVANNSLSLPDQGMIQIVLTLLLCLVIVAFFRVNDLRPRLGSRVKQEDRRLETR